MVSWATFAFGPAIFLMVNWWQKWVTDAATIGYLTLISAICFFVAVVSREDLTAYKERLGSVTSTATALFGWRKTEKSEN
jgi:hypothetical protein